MKCFNIHSNCAQGISYLPLSANYGATGTQRGLLRGTACPQVLLQPVRDARHFPPRRRYTWTLRAKTVLRRRWQVLLNLAAYRHQHPSRPNIVLNLEVTTTLWTCCFHPRRWLVAMLVAQRHVSALSHGAGDLELETLTPWPPRPAELFLMSPLRAETSGAFLHHFVGALLSGASHPASLFLVVLF